jgi:Heparinase II/III-like protein.
MAKFIKYYLLVFFSAFFVQGYSQYSDEYFFFSSKDLRNIKYSSRTDWGKAILDKLQNVVDERKKHPLEIPTLEGGHIHDYYCPKHNTQFVFDWDKPQEHYCQECKKYWSGIDKYDWAWVNFVHNENLRYLTANMFLFLSTDKSEYAENIKEMLLDLSTKYPKYKVHDRERKFNPGYSGKLFSQSLDEAVWVIDAARAYWAASSEMNDSEKETIKNGFLYPCAQLLMSSHDKGNWQIWHNGGITALGVALENDSIIDVALNKPELGYRDMLVNNVYSDGWWNEGSVVYHFYPLRSLVLTAEAVRCRGINLYEDRLFNMFMSPLNMVYSDLFFPSQNDGWYGTSLLSQSELYEIVAYRTRNPLFIKVLNLCYSNTKRSYPYSLVSDIRIKKGEKNITSKLKSTVFNDLGVGVLRSGNRTVVLKNGPHGGLHGHPDKLSISIHDGKREVLPDLGTTAYGVPDCMAWYQKTNSHNTVTVDGKAQNKTDCSIKTFEPLHNGGRIEAETDKAYDGVYMKRSLFLERKEAGGYFRVQV